MGEVEKHNNPAWEPLPLAEEQPKPDEAWRPTEELDLPAFQHAVSMTEHHEAVPGTKLTPCEEFFKEAYDAVEKLLEEKYGFKIIISDLVAPNTGDFQGNEIKLDYDQPLETAFFVMVHLAGHLIQWNTDDRLREIGLRRPDEIKEADYSLIREYERDASRYALELMKEAGVTGLDHWLEVTVDADWRYLEHIYRTGQMLPFAKFLDETKDQVEPLQPKPIPRFEFHTFASRQAF